MIVIKNLQREKQSKVSISFMKVGINEHRCGVLWLKVAHIQAFRLNRAATLNQKSSLSRRLVTKDLTDWQLQKEQTGLSTSAANEKTKRVWGALTATFKQLGRILFFQSDCVVSLLRFSLIHKASPLVCGLTELRQRSYLVHLQPLQVGRAVVAFGLPRFL